MNAKKNVAGKGATGGPKTPSGRAPVQATTPSERPSSAETQASVPFSERAKTGTRFIGLGIKETLALMWRTVIRVLVFSENWLLDGKKAKYGLAFTRIAFGVTGIGLLLTNFSTRIYAFGAGAMWNGEYADPPSDFPKLWIFSAFHAAMPSPALYTTLYVFLLVLAVLFTLGWRFKLVLPLYFCLWVSMIESTDSLGDQGDNMYRIAMVLLFFADPCQRWSLDSRRRAKGFKGSTARQLLAGRPLLQPWPEVQSVFHNLALVALTAQVCFVYASGALYKAQGDPWAGGYAIYAPLTTVQFGTWPELSSLLTTWGPMVTLVAWGSIIMQMCFPMMLIAHPTRVIALFAILSFHVGIGVLMGLPWFSLAMIAIDFVFITDRTWLSLIAACRKLWGKAEQGAPALPDDARPSTAVDSPEQGEDKEAALAAAGGRGPQTSIPEDAAVPASRLEQPKNA